MTKQRCRKTVLVLGAGASCPYSFPTAADVRQLIVQRDLHRIREIVAKLKTTTSLVDKVKMFIERFHEQAEIERFQREFFQSQITSVDAFVQSRKGEFELIAKRMTAAILLHCEAAANLDDDWYQLFRTCCLKTVQNFPPKDARSSLSTMTVHLNDICG